MGVGGLRGSGVGNEKIKKEAWKEEVEVEEKMCRFGGRRRRRTEKSQRTWGGGGGVEG